MHRLPRRWTRSIPSARWMCSASSQSKRRCIAYRLGLVDYETAWDWQKQLIQQRTAKDGGPLDDAILVLQHPSVYTLGRGATTDNLKFNPDTEKDVKVIRVDRGGEVTYHGPGQVVIYPILNLNYYKKDLHWYLRQVEETVIKTLAMFDIQGERVDGLTGVWVGESEEGMEKVAAIGTHASKWITMHGMAINTTTDLNAFDKIVPCGIHDRAVTSIEKLRPGVTTEDVEMAAIDAMKQVFNVDIDVIQCDSPFK